MNVLVINCGSSSLKFQLINSDTEAVLYISLQAKKKSEKKRRCQRIQKPLRWCFQR